jgi:hypothetical protein
MPDSQPIKLGLLIDSHIIPAWAYYAIEQLLASRCAQIDLLIINAAGTHSHNRGHREPSVARPLMFRLLDFIDRKIFGTEPNPFLPKDISARLSHVPSIQAEPIRDRLSDDAISRIRAYNLDILAQIGFRGLNTVSLAVSRYGVWHYQHSYDESMADDFQGFWEVIRKHPETEASLHASGGYLNLSLTLYRSWYFTYPLSPTRNRRYCFWAAAAFLPRQVELLYHMGEQKFFQEVKKYNLPGHSANGKSYGIPSNADSAVLLARLLGRWTISLLQRIACRDTWYLLFHVDGQAETGCREFRVMMPPEDRLWADPMLVQAGGKHYIFIEELLYKKNKGHISVVEMDDEGAWKDPVPVLQSRHHLSYPFVFQFNDRHYMIPECSSAGSIDLYECVRFPYEWRFKMTLMNNVIAVDTTLFYHIDQWWLFTAMAHHVGANPQVELFLFYANDFSTTNWHAHPKNPVISDIKKARPAGRIFTRNGKIYRPSQYSTLIYGYGFDINEIEVLTKTDYREKTVESVRPGPNTRLLATHTYATDGQLTVIDGFTRKWRFLSPIRANPASRKNVNKVITTLRTAGEPESSQDLNAGGPQFVI